LFAEYFSKAFSNLKSVKEEKIMSLVFSWLQIIIIFGTVATLMDPLSALNGTWKVSKLSMKKILVEWKNREGIT
jgi:hypothetical protein